MCKNALNRTTHIKWKPLFLINRALEAMELCEELAGGSLKHVEDRENLGIKSQKLAWPVQGTAGNTEGRSKG